MVLDQNGDTVPGLTATFEPSPPGRLSVSPGGLITSLGPAGGSVVAITVASLMSHVPVTIMPVPTSISRLPAALTLGQQGYFPLRGARVLDRIGNDMPGAVVSYGSSASSVIEILPGNFVHSVGPLGAATVTATYANSFAQVTDSLPVTVNQYAVPTGTIIDSFPTGTATYGVAVSKAVSYVSVPDPSGPVQRFDLPARQFGSVVPGVGAGLGVAFDPSGSQAYVATLQDGLAVINPTTNAIDSHIGYPMVGSQRDVIVSPDGLRLYVATAHVRIYIINTATRQVIDSIPVPGLPNHFSWHPAGSRLYASLDNGQVAEIDVSAGQVTRLFPTGSASQGTAVAPDGSELYNVTENNELFVVDLATGNQVANVVGLGGFGLVATPDGSRLYVAGGPNVKIVDRLSRTLIDSIVVGGGARRIALSRDGGTAFVANQAGWVNVIY